MGIVNVQQLGKRYGDFWALKNCSLEIPEGAVFGLLGPNGAGKTTLIRCLLGFIRPTEGKAIVEGFDCLSESLQVRERVSYLPAETKLFRTMKGKDCLEFFASIHPRGDLGRAKSIADRLGLNLSRRVAFMSTGMRQKLAIACVLSCNSRVIILDEPTANLDPTTRQTVLELTAEANQQRGATVVFCSHVMSEIQDICQYAAFLKGGTVVETVRLDAIEPVHRARFRTTEPERISEWFPGSKHSVTAVAESENVVSGALVVVELRGEVAPYLARLQSSAISELTIDLASVQVIYDRVHKLG